MCEYHKTISTYRELDTVYSKSWNRVKQELLRHIIFITHVKWYQPAQRSKSVKMFNVDVNEKMAKFYTRINLVGIIITPQQIHIRWWVVKSHKGDSFRWNISEPGTFRSIWIHSVLVLFRYSITVYSNHLSNFEPEYSSFSRTMNKSLFLNIETVSLHHWLQISWVCHKSNITQFNVVFAPIKLYGHLETINNN